jgi:hypothetical protein
MLECQRCGALADLLADGGSWCGAGCLELARRGVPYEPEEAPLRLEGAERVEAVDAMLDARLDVKLDELERAAGVNMRDILRRPKLSRVTLPETDSYGRVVDPFGGERG